MLDICTQSDPVIGCKIYAKKYSLLSHAASLRGYPPPQNIGIALLNLTNRKFLKPVLYTPHGILQASRPQSAA